MVRILRSPEPDRDDAVRRAAARARRWLALLIVSVAVTVTAAALLIAGVR